MTLRAFLTLLFLAFAAPCLAATLADGPLNVAVPDAVGEGQLFLVEVRLANRADKVSVTWMGKTVDLAMSRSGDSFTGELLLGVGLGCPHTSQNILVEAQRPGRNEKVTGTIQVSAVDFPQQRLTLPPKMVTPSKEDQARITREQELIKKAVDEVSLRKSWEFPFLRPVPGEVTSAFGLRRILNGLPRSSHSGIDFNAQTGDPILAANRGRVILTGDFYYNGKSVFVDHGQGVITMYFHLSRIDVASGQSLERGHLVGLAGATGRVTGPHLHFGMKILGQAVDPMPLFAPGGRFDRPAREGS